MALFDQAYGLLVHLHTFFMGITFALSAVASVLFLRFYRRTSDRLFVFFGAAFAVMAVNRLAFLATNAPTESQPFLYIIRLMAFGLILFGIIDKNSKRRRGQAGGGK